MQTLDTVVHTQVIWEEHWNTFNLTTQLKQLL